MTPAPRAGPEATRVTPLNSESQRSTPDQCLGSKSSLQEEEGPLGTHALLVPQEGHHPGLVGSHNHTF